MYVLNKYMAFGVDTPYIAPYNFKLVFHLLFSTIYSKVLLSGERRCGCLGKRVASRLNRARPFLSPRKQAPAVSHLFGPIGIPIWPVSSETVDRRCFHGGDLLLAPLGCLTDLVSSLPDPSPSRNRRSSGALAATSGRPPIGERPPSYLPRSSLPSPFCFWQPTSS